MSTHHFTWGEDPRGEDGWLLQGHPNFWAADPRNLVHDCLEHLPRGEQHGPAADELLALGARFYLRGTSGWWEQQAAGPFADRRNRVQLMTDELLFLHRELGDSIPYLESRSIGDYDCEINAIVANAVDAIARDQIEEVDPSFGPNCAAWLRAGYRAAVKRYKGTDPLNIMWLAEQLEARLQLFAQATHGEKLIIKIHEKDQEFKVTYKPHPWND